MVFGFAPHAAIQRPAATDVAAADSGSTDNDRRAQRLSRRERRRMKQAAEAQEPPVVSDTLVLQADSLLPPDSLRVPSDSLQRDTTRRKKEGGAFLEDIMNGKNTDSLVYDIRNKMVYIYNEGDINYQDMNLKADFMRVNMDTREIYAYGKPDTLEGQPTVTRPEFTEGSASPYKMDTITYNFKSGKAKIKGVATQEGDGWLIGGSVKKMPDNNINIQGGKYTTCDQTDHPHFYLAMTKAKVIPGKKVVTGPAYLVMEDVPIYFLGIPEGFFPISSGPKSGFLMPTYGEDGQRGFFFRDFGYYFTLSQHMDLALTAGIYTLGSWEGAAASRYIKRYKYTGNLNAQFSSIRTGEKGEPDFLKQNTFRLQWTHSQDPKANPGSTFSASVNFATSGYSKYAATTINDILQTQTNSTISYSKNWAGTPFSLSMNMAVSQNSQNSTISMTLPNIVFNVSRFYPFKRREAQGKARWYEKISMQYTGKMTNTVSTTESEVFTKQTLENMRNGIEHSIPVTASFNLFNYINVSPSFNYTEKWYFKKQEREWSPVTNEVRYLDPEYGFYRLYNYTTSVSASTTLYGMYQFKKKTSKIQAIRHTLTPSFGFSYAPRLLGSEIRLLQNRTDRFHRQVPGLFALRRQCLRRSQFGPQHVDELLAVADARDEGALQARHVGHQEDQADRQPVGQRLVQLPGRLDEALDHSHPVPHDGLRHELRHPAQRHARPVQGHPPKDGASTNSSFRDVSFRRAGRSVIPSNRGRITPRPRSTTSTASRPNTPTPSTTPTASSTLCCEGSTWRSRTTTSRCRGTSASTTRSPTRSTTSTTVRRATARTSRRTSGSTAASTSRPRWASRSRAVTTSRRTS